jgi:hypothetical protein
MQNIKLIHMDGYCLNIINWIVTGILTDTAYIILLAQFG